MELAPHDPGSKLLRPDEPELDLYTIPSHSSWFSWDEIHETERIALKEYFDGSSISRTPKTYKEYRDFIISKYREDPSRKLTFTECKFGCQRWFWHRGEERSKVKVEDGVPNGIRVAAMPNSIKPISPISAPPKVGDAGVGVVNRITLAPLASYSDVFGDLKKEEGLVCGNCGGHCETGHYKYSKGDFLICIKCFENGNYGENKLRDDFQLNEAIEKSGTKEICSKHGDDWELVAQNVQTKTKFDCIAKLIDLPFGELVLGSAYRKGNPSGFSGNLISSEHIQLSSSECQETVKTKGQLHEQTDDSKQNGDILDQGPPLKRQRIASLSDASSSLIKQVAAITTMVGPHITSAAAEAAVNALCEETSCSREIFNADDDSIPNGLWSPAKNCETERVHGEDSEMKESQLNQFATTNLEYRNNGEVFTVNKSWHAIFKKDDIPPTLQIRAAIGTALGAAAAHAKLLADQEDRQIEHLMATIIGTQMKKLHSKLKHFEDLELIRKKECAQIEEVEDILVEERINILQRTFDSGVPRWRDHPSLKS
ncbi:SWI/SNF complex subunit SWI3A [Prunus yedoensis var. nudiflora]|uniref:SWI/SNF complex subunit SWI3A n=1 Tax=Prunus yedoensis var. nudiflora TaxID=2094558 RepID=A0A314ZKB8_PRUYE|nr:SWI/SNF complex subunit SWI3A [Prunus yedoensis var. nudiflora]